MVSRAARVVEVVVGGAIPAWWLVEVEGLVVL